MSDESVRRWRPVIGALLVNVALPLGLYYGLRGAGVGAVPALLAGGVLPAARTLYTAVRHRRIDALGVLVLAMMMISAVLAMMTGDPRALLARESWGTGFFGVWVLGSLLTARPAILALGAEVMPADRARDLLDRWSTEPAFRSNVRRISALWGGAFLLDAAVRVWMAFALPVDVVPGTSSALMIGLLVVVTLLSRPLVRTMTTARAAVRPR